MTSRASRIARLARLAAADVRIAPTIALWFAAASTGVIIPMLRLLVEETGHGTVAGGLFAAAHVVGGAVGAAFGARALRRAGSPRRLAAAALIASVPVSLAMAAVGSLELRLALRVLDGGCHLLAITALVAALTSGDPDQRARRAVIVGIAIVLGIVGGIGLAAGLLRPGALVLATGLSQPAAALVMAAALSGAALLVVVKAIPAERPTFAAPGRPRPRRLLAPGMLGFCERFSFGSMTIALPFLAEPPRVGLVIGVFMVASVLAMVVAWRAAPRLGPRKLAVRAALGYGVALASSAAIDPAGSPAVAAIWAIAAGAAAGSLYASALVLAMRSAELEDRTRGMATVHAAGSAGHALGALSAGTLALALPGMLVIALPSVAVLAAAAIGVWLTVPEAASDCPVIGGLDGAAGPATRPTPH